ncbi:unnamed protein product [Mytilus edulis]|uniref:Fibrinogen C-terminal domain-containing protein n=1 Tax=Mytilus edulis TaxID=6550 RepID=A0A8S3S4B7_MYTED|nr:unnamed protein product [Mytilus edulis]
MFVQSVLFQHTLQDDNVVGFVLLVLIANKYANGNQLTSTSDSGRRVRDCSDLDPKHFKSGVYTIKPAGGTGLKAYCDMETDGGGWTTHNNQAFTTKDKDNDIHSYENCAKIYKGAWWYYACYASNLNGLYVGNKKDDRGINWQLWKGSQSMKTTSMMIRRNRL